MGSRSPRRVLYLVHGLPPTEFTGTPLVAEQYAAGLGERGWIVAVVYADPGTTRWPTIPRRTVRPAIRLAVPPTGLGTWALSAAAAPRSPEGAPSRFFETVLHRFRPDLVHVVDNVHLPMDWPELAAHSGVPVVRTVSSTEDLCAVVPPVSPRSDPVGYCEAPLTPERCSACVEATYGPEFGWPIPPTQQHDRAGWLLAQLQVKRARAEYQFGSVFSRIVFSTAPWRRFFEQTIPLDAERTRVIEMGMDLKHWLPFAEKTPPSPDEPVVFVLAGSLHVSRGQLDALRAFNRPELLGRDDYRLVLWGAGDPGMVAPLVAANRRVEIAGGYQPHELPARLARADVGLSPSLFETFHRVTREYLLAGLPVVANPTLGIEGLIVHEHNGLLYDRTDEGSLARAVCRLLDDRALLARLTAGAAATRPAIRGVDDEVDELLGLYEEVLGSTAPQRGSGRLARLRRALR